VKQIFIVFKPLEMRSFKKMGVAVINGFVAVINYNNKVIILPIRISIISFLNNFRKYSFKKMLPFLEGMWQ